MFSLHFRVCRFKKRYPGAGDERTALARPEPPLPTGGQGHARCSEAQLEPPLPTGGWGHARRSSPCPPGTRCACAALARGWSPPPTGGWGGTCRSGAWPAEKTFFVKHQPKLYLVDVLYQTSTGSVSWLMFDIKSQPEFYLVDV